MRVRVALVMVCLARLVGAASAQTISLNGIEPPTGVTLAAAAPVLVDIAGGPGNAGDWIGLYPTGASDSAYVSWSYLSGTSTPPATGLADASLVRTAPVAAGTYEWRLYANSSFTRVATSGLLTVTASASAVVVNGAVAPASTTAVAGSTLVVTVTLGPGNPTDWVALAAAGAPDSDALDWRYLNDTTVAPSSGLTGGTLTFLASAAPGAYEVRFFAVNSYGRLATSGPVHVTASPAALVVNGTAPPTAVPVAAGTYVTVDVTAGPGHPGDWVGLFAANAADSAFLSWRYLNGATTLPVSGFTDATLSFGVPVTPGSYELRFFNANSYVRLATSTSLVVSAAMAQVAVNGVASPTSTTAAPGTQAIVSVAAGPGNAGDWVGLYAAGAADSEVLDWRYLNDTGTAPATGVTTGTLHVGVPTTAGTYEFRFFMDYTFGRLATSGPLVVPQTPAQIAVNGTAPPTSVTVAPGSTITATITGGPGNPTDWVALAVQGAPNSAYVSWQYLNGSTIPPSIGLTSGTVSVTLPSGPATYELRLFASNSPQRVVSSAPIVASTAPPVVTLTLTSPFPGTTFNAPASLVVAAHATISGGTIQHVDFYDGAALIGTATASPYAVTWTAPAEGLHTLTAVAVDQTSATTTSAPVTVSIAPAGPTLGMLGTPLITPEGGAFSLPQTVSLAATVGATIHYTLDWSAPTTVSPIYTGPFTVTDSTAVLAVAVMPGWTDSDPASTYFYIDSVAPTIDATTPTNGAQNVGIGSPITVVFSEPMASSTVTADALELRTAGGMLVPSSVWYDESAESAVIQPITPLALAATYAVTVKGGLAPATVTDVMGNRIAAAATWSFSTQATVTPPTISTTGELHVRNATFVTLSAEDRDPQDIPLTYSWTQVAGPPVDLRGATTPILSLVTPDSDALLRFRATVTNGFSTAFTETDVYVRQYTTAFGLATGPAEGNTSDLSAAAPALRDGYLFERLADGLSIQLTSVTGRVLQPTAADPFSVSVTSEAGTTDVTALFSYSSTTNAVVLNLGAEDALRQALGDGRAELSISAPDSAGDYAHIAAPILRAVARINGTTQVVQGSGSTAGGSVQLTDEAGAFRASAMISSSGTFVLDDIPAGSYELTLDAADGVTGWANLTVPSNPSGGSLAVNIEARSTAGLDPRQWPCDAIFPSTYEGQPTTCTEEYFMVVPRGSAQLSVQVLAYSPNQQSCSVLADWGYAYNHGKSSVRLFLDGLPITRLEMPFCNMGENQIVFEKSLNVSSLARDRDLVVRGLRTKTSDYSPYFYYHQGVPQQMTGGLDGVIDWQPTPRLTITSVTDRVGAGPIKLSEEEPKGAETKDKFLGVPYDNVGTYAGSGVNDHRWRLRINYSPANAQIAAVRVFVVGPGLQEPLAFDQGPAADGKLDLTNVGFPEFQPHVLWHAKYNRLSIVVELDGVAPDRPAATATGELGIGTDHGPWLLTALYDAARIAGSGGRRYSTDRNTNQGGDGWSAESAYAFLESNTDLVFNDISLEHGGYMSPHSGQGHRVGRGIDVRYFGAGGDGNPLNGTALAPDGSPDRDLGTVRGARVLLAESGNAQAQTEIVDWIQQNRARIGQLLTDSRVEKVLIGDATWNWQSLVEGKYPGGSQIHDTAAAGQPWIGRWQPTGLTPWSAHLSHVHIEIARRP